MTARELAPTRRAKALRPGDSGLFRLGHALDNAANLPDMPASNDGDSTAVQSFPSRMRSPEKAAVRAEVCAILDTCAALHGLSNAALGATINESEEDTRRIRLGVKPCTADHLLRIARRRLALYEDIDARLRGKAEGAK